MIKRVGVDDVIGALNGVLGDYLVRTKNGLAFEMEFVREEPKARRIALFVHGLMATDGCWSLFGMSYPEELEKDLGIAPLYVRYNSGRHISENGRDLHELLDLLALQHGDALEEIVLIGHSMGGLVIRSATHFASVSEKPATWLHKVKKAFYIGSPHLGAPLERFGNALTWALQKTGAALSDPVAEVLAQTLSLRSSGIKDLRYGNLRDEDWADRDPDALLSNSRHPVPLLPSIRHHLIAGILPQQRELAAFFGDGIVPPSSALGRARDRDKSPIFPEEHVRIFERVSHTQLLADRDVYEQLRSWCAE